MPFVFSRTTDSSEADRDPLATARVDRVHQNGAELVVIEYETNNHVTADPPRARTREVPSMPAAAIADPTRSCAKRSKCARDELGRFVPSRGAAG